MINRLTCRAGCGACCIAASISSTIPGMPRGKPANMTCIHLDSEMRCRIFGHAERPKVCSSLQPCIEMCGNHRDDALQYLMELEIATASG